jgi:hypothetical protein
MVDFLPSDRTATIMFPCSIPAVRYPDRGTLFGRRIADRWDLGEAPPDPRKQLIG